MNDSFRPICASPLESTLLLTLSLVFVSLGACVPASATSNADRVFTEPDTIELSVVVFSGNRYVAQADLGLEKPVPLMIHGNARMYLMVTHQIGEQLTRGPVAKVDDYGYSAKGRGMIRVPLLRLGGRRMMSIPDVPVFDYVAEGRSAVQGMVGVPFLISERAAVDFSRDVMLLGTRPSLSPDKRFMKLGYRVVPTSVDSTNRVTIRAYFPSLRRTISITPSTVSTALTLHRPPFAGRLPMRRDTTSTDHSPSGTHPDLYHSDAVAFEIAGVKFATSASLEDFAEYADVPESELSSLGILGFDWMKEHGAIIDYANQFLYFKP